MRRAGAAAILAAGLVLTGAAWAGPKAAPAPAAAAAADSAALTIGREDAPVRLVEFASVTCGHCAHWQATVWPQVKARFVDTGRVRFEVRALPTPPREASKAGFILVRCAAPERRYDTYAALLENQRWLQSSPRAWLTAGAEAAGMSEDQARACTTDAANFVALQARVEAGLAEHPEVEGTPSFFLNGRAVDGWDLEALERAVTAAETAAARRRGR